MRRSPWEVLDFGDVLLHVFTDDERQYYDLESFYKGAAEVCPCLALRGVLVRRAGGRGSDFSPGIGSCVSACPHLTCMPLAEAVAAHAVLMYCWQRQGLTA